MWRDFYQRAVRKVSVLFPQQQWMGKAEDLSGISVAMERSNV